MKNSGGVNKKVSGGVNLQDKILQEIRNNGGLNAPSLASRLSLSLRTVQRYLKQLTESKKSSSAVRPRTADIIRVEETKKDDNFAALVAGGARNGLAFWKNKDRKELKSLKK